MSTEQSIASLTPEDYKAAFSILRERMTETDLRLLRAHYEFPNYDVTATQLAYALSFKNYGAVNLRYGHLASKFCDFFGIYPQYKSSILVIFKELGREWHWIMRPAVIQALDELGWFKL